MLTNLAAYRSSQELFANLTLRELRSKYKRSFLGWTWSMVNPLANMIVYTIVFSKFLRVNPGRGHPSGLNEYALWLLCAMLPWNFFQGSVMGSIGSLVGNANLVKKTYFPRELLPASNVAANVVSHAIEMGVLLVALLVFGDYRALFFLPFLLLLMAVTSVFALGLGLMLSVLNVYFRDIEHFMSILFLVWFFGTPIVYPITTTGVSKYATILKINPMTDMADSFRAVLYNGTFPGWIQLLYFMAWAAGIFLLGRWVFNRMEGRLAEEL